MAQGTLKAGIYAYLIRNKNNAKWLTLVRYDGNSLSGQIDCVIRASASGPAIPTPDVAQTPCAVWEADGAYSREPCIHVFLTIGNGSVWWLTSTDGVNFLRRSESVANMPTTQPVAAVMLGREFHFYYNNARSRNQELWHARSTGGYTCQSTEGVSLNAGPINLNWSVAVAMRGGLPNVVFGQNTSMVVRMIYLAGPDPSNPGNGRWAENGPTGSTCWHAPGLASLGEALVVVHQGAWYSHGVDQRVFWEQSDGRRVWSTDLPITDALTTDSPGICNWNDRLYCFFQSSDRNLLYVTVYVDGAWLSRAVNVSGVDGVWYGVTAVAVHSGRP